jgi:hypothetical protein
MYKFPVLFFFFKKSAVLFQIFIAQDQGDTNQSWIHHRIIAQFAPSLPTAVGMCVISGFRRDVDEICALLGYYTALNGSSVPTFRDNLSVPYSRVKNSLEDPWRWDR